MKKLLLLTAIALFLSCSSDDDCEGNSAEIKARYEALLENDKLSAEQRALIIDDYAEELENSCT